MLISLPLLPIMYFQGKRIRASVPKLPEATGTTGSCKPGVESRKSLRLITLGESTIAGVGVANHDEGFTGTLAKELSKSLNLNVDWSVYARSGYTARLVNQKILPKITETEIDLIVVGLGGNDAFTLNKPAKWRQEVEKLIEDLHTKFPEAIIVFCNMPPIKEFPAFTSLIKFTVGNLVEILGLELVKLVRKYDFVYYSDEIITLDGWINRYQLKEDKSAFFSDGVHPSKLTYQTWARDVADKIISNTNL